MPNAGGGCKFRLLGENVASLPLYDASRVLAYLTTALRFQLVLRLARTRVRLSWLSKSFAEHIHGGFIFLFQAGSAVGTWL